MVVYPGLKIVMITNYTKTLKLYKTLIYILVKCLCMLAAIDTLKLSAHFKKFLVCQHRT